MPPQNETAHILVTDLSVIEWHASRFIRQCQSQEFSVPYPKYSKEIGWKNPPPWVNEENSLPVYFCRCQLENQWINLYSFPEAIKRDFLLDDVDIQFDGVLLVVNLGNKRFWENRIKYLKGEEFEYHQPSKGKALMVWDPNIKYQLSRKEKDRIFSYRLHPNGDPRRIWGLELVNQVQGEKLVLAVKSSPDSVPASYIREYLHLDPPTSILECDFDPGHWDGLGLKFSDEIIQDTLSLLGQIVQNV